MGSPAPISEEIRRSAKQGELQKVFKWLRKGRLVGALFPTNTAVRSGCDHVQHGFGVLHAAAAYDQVETVRELLKRRVSIDRPNGYGYTALMVAAGHGRLSIVLVLLHHSACPDLQSPQGASPPSSSNPTYPHPHPHPHHLYSPSP